MSSGSVCVVEVGGAGDGKWVSVFVMQGTEGISCSMTQSVSQEKYMGTDTMGATDYSYSNTEIFHIFTFILQYMTNYTKTTRAKDS